MIRTTLCAFSITVALLFAADWTFGPHFRKRLAIYDGRRNIDVVSIGTYEGRLWLEIVKETTDAKQISPDRVIDPTRSWLCREWEWLPDDQPAPDSTITLGASVVLRAFGFLAYIWHDPRFTVYTLRLPEWSVVSAALCSALATSGPLRRAYRARQRRARGACVACGYDLRGGPEA
jgi:hypothetical protein